MVPIPRPALLSPAVSAVTDESVISKVELAPAITGLTRGDEMFSAGSNYFGWALASNFFFLVGSALYVALAFVALDYEERAEAVGDEVLAADDDYTWYCAGWTDDYVLKGITNKEVWVSLAQVLYFCAALCFTITGTLDFWYRPAYFAVVMSVAGLFGLISAMLLEKDEHTSLVFNSISVHLFGLEAVEVLFLRAPVPGIDLWVRGGDLFFLIGTLFDIVLSYHLLQSDYNLYSVTGAKLAVFAAFNWLAASIVYVGTTIYMRKHDGLETTGDDKEGVIVVDDEGQDEEHGDDKDDRDEVLSAYEG